MDACIYYIILANDICDAPFLIILAMQQQCDEGERRKTGSLEESFPQLSPFNKSSLSPHHPPEGMVVNSGYEIPRNILEKDYLKVV